MATTSSSAKNATAGFPWRRLLFLLGALVVFRIGAHIPVPGIDSEQLALLFRQNQGGILGMFNMFSGGALSRFTVFALGIMPYISASIIMQMLGIVSPQIDALKKEGEAGRRKMTQYTRYGTLVLAAFQGLGIAVALESQPGLVIDPGLAFRFTAVVTLVTGTMFLMWLGEQITERGLGNGISMIIFAGIAAGLPNAIGGLVELVRTGSMNTLTALIICVIVAIVTFLVVFIESGQRRILVNYAKRQVGNKIYGGQSSFLPLKVNMAGVIPPIFASSLLLLPITIANLSAENGPAWVQELSTMLGHGQPLYLALYAFLIAFFAFFYTAIVFNPEDTAENLKKHGGFIAGIRPGKNTAEYLDYVITRLTVLGAVYLVGLCILPEVLISKLAVPFVLGGTTLLIVVQVTMDFVGQLQSHLIAYQYESLIKKASLANRKRR